MAKKPTRAYSKELQNQVESLQESKRAQQNYVISTVKRQTGFSVPLDTFSMVKLGWIDNNGRRKVPANFVDTLADDLKAVDITSVSSKDKFHVRPHNENEHENSEVGKAETK
ncbi:hypothetical protein M514_00521 [Trichuris suis]|uniref:Uncharacterized protein n=1 Tax=Trichuris suis TaxID=68888 RepID=A0A085NRM2_9BILA|nr:hypothetical protein M513_00521 [Trichuris suis]KFD72118.1 hypothetical protein M514_00521 [Trichuris suis]